MSTITKIITLTQADADSGPNYEVYASDDCTNYTLITTVNLPSVGNTALVNVPVETTCIKLVNINSLCSNEVVKSVTPPTTTTTTTVAPTTTTTTTEALPEYFRVILYNENDVDVQSCTLLVPVEEYDLAYAFEVGPTNDPYFECTSGGGLNALFRLKPASELPPTLTPLSTITGYTLSTACNDPGAVPSRFPDGQGVFYTLDTNGNLLKVTENGTDVEFEQCNSTPGTTTTTTTAAPTTTTTTTEIIPE